MLGRGDFNADGFDDILVLSNAHATEGKGAWTDIYLLTRWVPGAVLYVLNANKNHCRHYQCDQTYDDPDVLRETDPARAD